MKQDLPQYQIVPLERQVSKHFDCDESSLNQYLKQYAKQHIKKRISSVKVAVDKAARILGYYTLSACGTSKELMPQAARGGMPANLDIPCYLLGRLAVDKAYQKLGLGKALFAHALNDALLASEYAGGVLIFVDPKNDSLKKYYENPEFVALESNPGRYYLNLKTIAQAKLANAKNTTL